MSLGETRQPRLPLRGPYWALALLLPHVVSAVWAPLSDLADLELEEEQEEEVAKEQWQSLGPNTACKADATDTNDDGHGTATDEPAKTLDACKALCTAKKTCQGIMFNQQAGACSVWDEPIGQGTNAPGSECLRLLNAGAPEVESPEDNPKTWSKQVQGEEQCNPADCADGDEVLDPAQKRDSLLQANLTVKTIVASKWPNGIVKYFWDPFINPDIKQTFLWGMIEWEAKTCIRFQESPVKGRGVVNLKSSGQGCNAHIGYSPYWERWVNLGEGCNTVGTAVHELGHAIGLGHEHQRSDAGNYVEIVQQNIVPQQQNQFTVMREGEVAASGVPYDLASIMHYGDHFFAIRHDDKPESKTIRVRRKDVYGNCQVGQRNYLSTGDILTVNRWYGCPDRFCADLNENCKTFVAQNLCADKKYAPWMDANCRHSCGFCRCEDKDQRCPQLATDGYCLRGRGDVGTVENKYWMAENCPKSCGRCSHDDKGLCKDQMIWDDPQGCVKKKDTVYEGKKMCLHTFFRDRCPKSCNLCPHAVFCW